jgi:hypothetical protein
VSNPLGIGGFRKGFDARRKLLTQDDRRRGYANAPSRIKARIRGLYKGGRIMRRGETVYPEYEDVA